MIPEPGAAAPKAGRKVKNTLHWVEASHTIPAEVRLYEHLFLARGSENDKDCTDLSASSTPTRHLEVLENCLVEPALAEARVGDRFNSSGMVISVWIRILHLELWFSTALSPCAIPGPRLRKARPVM